MGFDIRPYGDAKADYDFNDVLIKLTASPVSAVKPEEDIPVLMNSLLRRLFMEHLLLKTSGLRWEIMISMIL
ncbi:hypothetical protein OWT79_12195 [Bacteroides fragilis]|nr:hypothetical protein [Bacteroides fragilis]